MELLLNLLQVLGLVKFTFTRGAASSEKSTRVDAFDETEQFYSITRDLYADTTGQKVARQLVQRFSADCRE